MSLYDIIVVLVVLGIGLLVSAIDSLPTWLLLIIAAVALIGYTVWWVTSWNDSCSPETRR